MLTQALMVALKKTATQSSDYGKAANETEEIIAEPTHLFTA